MPTITPQQALTLLNQPPYAPIYFLQGEESYYIDRITSYIQQQIVPENEKTFNLHILYGKETTSSHIIAQAQQYPFLGERQVIIVKEAQDLSDLHYETTKKIFANYLQHPNPSTLLVIAYKYKTLSAASPLATILAEKAVVVNAKTLYDNHIPNWIKQYAADKGFSLTPEATHQLQELTGNELTRLANELDKIIINLQPGDTITDTHIQTYVGFSKPFNAYELQKALALKNAYKAYQIILQITDPTAIMPLLGLLCNFFVKLLHIHHTPGATPQQLAQILKLNSYFIADYTAAAKRYPVAKIIQNISHLHETDKQVKGISYSPPDGVEILKELVYKLLH